MGFKKRLFLFTVFLLLLFLFVTYQSIRGKGRPSGVPSHPFRLISQAGTLVVDSVTDFFHAYILVVGKERENRRLKEQLRSYEDWKNRCVEAEYERDRLRSLIELKAETPHSVVAAKVFARDPTNWFQQIWINKGARDGIERNMIAVTPVGPVGHIHSVYEEEASILLITDVNSSVAARVQPSRLDGILEGRGGRRSFLKYIQQEMEVIPGERVITSGLDGRYPAGLLLGYVMHVRKQDQELFQEIEVAPAQNLSTVEEVIILKR